MAHFFTTKRGKALRQSVLRRDLFKCQMCGVIVTDGRSHKRAANVDHIEPIALAPHRVDDETNCRTVCRSCHAICDSIEKRAQGDLQRIVREKLSYRPVGLDGYPVARSGAL